MKVGGRDVGAAGQDGRVALSKGSQRNHKESVHKQMEITDPSNTLRDCVRDYCALGLSSVCSSSLAGHNMDPKILPGRARRERQDRARVIIDILPPSPLLSLPHSPSFPHVHVWSFVCCVMCFSLVFLFLNLSSCGVSFDSVVG